MLTDARTLAGDETIHSDVCIVGSGPAGMTLSRELIGQRFQVCLLESGGPQFEKDTQALYEGEVDGEGLVPLDAVRTRQFGGTPNQWHIDIGDRRLGCRFLPLDEIDFEKREWIPYSGWPFKKADLDPYYQRAQATCGIGPYAYSPEAWNERGAPGPLFDGPAIVSSVFQFGPRGHPRGAEGCNKKPPPAGVAGGGGGGGVGWGGGGGRGALGAAPPPRGGPRAGGGARARAGWGGGARGGAPRRGPAPRPPPRPARGRPPPPRPPERPTGGEALWGGWAAPRWSRGDRASLLFTLANVLLLVVAPELMDHTIATTWAAILADLHPFPRH
jgi:hypothetical protein